MIFPAIVKFDLKRYKECEGMNLDLEGRVLTNHKDDWGGPTSYGITQVIFSYYLNQRGEQDRHVREMRHYEMEDIYTWFYYLPGRCHNLIRQMDFVMFQWCVNRGTFRATKTLQMALSALGHYNGKIDGIFGPKSIGAANDAVYERLVAEFLNTQNLRYVRIIEKSEMKRRGLRTDVEKAKFKDQRVNGPGWLNRTRRTADMIEFKYDIPAPIEDVVMSHYKLMKEGR